MYNTHAIVRRDNGMVAGVGSSERAAWADARRKAHVVPDDPDHACREAAPGHQWKVEDTAGGRVAMQAPLPHRPRRDPAAARVVRPYRLHPDTIAQIDAQAKAIGESAGVVIDQLADGLQLGYRLVRIRYQAGSAAGRPVVEAGLFNGNVAPRPGATHAEAGEALVAHLRQVRRVEGPILYEGKVPVGVLMREIDRAAVTGRGRRHWERSDSND